MEGVTDMAFREMVAVNLVKPDVLFTEFVSADGIVYNKKNIVGEKISLYEAFNESDEADFVAAKILEIADNNRAGDVFKSLADIRKIEKLLGYKPMVNFEEGLIKTTEWFRTHNKRSESKYTLSNKE